MDAGTLKEWALLAWEKAQFWTGYERELLTLGFYAIGFALYALAVFLTCETISRRDLVRDHVKPKSSASRMQRFLRGAGFLALYPLVTAGYFAFLGASLFFLAKNQPTAGLLLSTMGIVVALRLSAYLTSSIARDVAKLLPLSLLAVFVIEPGYFSFATAWARFGEALSLWPLLVRYFVALSLLEITLRVTEVIWTGAARRVRARRGAKGRKETVRIVPANAPPAEFETVRPRQPPARPPA